MISAGWDTGELELLEETLCRIKQRLANLIWINPLAANPKYEPTVQGMRIALPYIDVLTSFK
jgi:uncharacterized protein with von Willebrand factor type A (vWA) domain